MTHWGKVLGETMAVLMALMARLRSAKVTPSLKPWLGLTPATRPAYHPPACNHPLACNQSSRAHIPAQTPAQPCPRVAAAPAPSYLEPSAGMLSQQPAAAATRFPSPEPAVMLPFTSRALPTQVGWG